MRVKIVRNLCIAVNCFCLSSIFAAPVMPTAPGTSWRYNMTEEIGKGLNVSNVKADADGRIRLPVLYRLEGTENVDGKDLLKFEMHRAGTVTNTDLLSVDDHGIACWARMNLDGELKVQQHYDVVAEEEIDVPAGRFQAFRIHGEQTSPNRMTIDRWFTPG